MLTSKPDLRQRIPPTSCLPHPCDCSNCAWQFVTTASPGYQPGTKLPAAYEELPGAYRGHCGSVQPVRVQTPDGEEIGAIRHGRYYQADTTSDAFLRYREDMGLSAA